MPGAPRPSRFARSPARFRRRLTAAFVLVAAFGAGLVAVLGMGFATEYRWRSFRQQALDEARIALALAPRNLDAERFERLRAEYEDRSDSNIVTAGAGGTFSSSADLSLDDVPRSLRETVGRDLQAATADVDGRRQHVVAAVTEEGQRFWFFFSVRQVESSLREFARATAAAWVVTVVVAGAAGRAVARRTLRPVAEAAVAAEAIESGERGARLDEGPDEFGAWAASFNRMADTVERTIDQLRRAAERERRFTADVAHELRTPLTGLAASASLLRDQLDDLPDDARPAATLLVTETERLRSLVLELLELSRLDSASDPVDVEPLAVRRAVGAVLATLGPSTPDEVEIDVDDDIRVLAEPRRLDRIVTNLLANAGVHGRSPVTVLARPEGELVRIEFADRGDGIPPDELPNVFDRFAKSDASRATGGTGLGLPIARAHARAQGGDITVANREGGGACFTLWLPAADVDGNGNGVAP